MDISVLSQKILAEGWTADESDYVGESEDEIVFEALVHELAHNLLLNDLDNPKKARATSKLIKEQFVWQRDRDEIRTTAITLAVFYFIDAPKFCSEVALSMISYNLTSRANHKNLKQRIKSMSKHRRVRRRAFKLIDYIQSL